MPPATAPGSSRPKGVPQEVELDLIVLPSSIRILAVDDSRLVWMQFQTTLLQAASKGLQQCFCFGFRPHVDQHVICIPFESNLRMIPPHPFVEGVMQKQVRQDRAYH